MESWVIEEDEIRREGDRDREREEKR